VRRNSRFRELFADDFGPSADAASAKFIWFGTTYMFDGLTFVHQDGPHGVFAAHAYPIGQDLSTFVVETDAGTWAAAGLDAFDPVTPPGPSDEKTEAYLEDLFRDQIDGHPLVGNNSRWASFATRRARSWRRGHWVLLGDAAHTAHFSVGSGTKMAMEDAVALAEALNAFPYSVSDALELYEERRRPEVEKIQNSARPSLSWWEHFGRYVRRFDDPVQFTFHFLTRRAPRALPSSTATVSEALTAMEIARYKLPEHLMLVDELPLTKVGKIDKKTLRDLVREKTPLRPSAARSLPPR
jgi:salicyloyl-CoA 5-hydroxylase